MSDALSQGDIINILNRVIKILTSHEGKSFEDIMADGIRPIADALDLSRVVIYRKVKTDTEEWVGQVYLWDRTIGTAPLDELLKVLPPIPAVKQWYSIALKGEFVIRKLSKMSAEEVSFANMFGIKSIMLVPVFMKGSFWGAVAFQDHVNEQDFSCHTDLLSSLAHLFADEAIKEEMRQKNSKYIEMLEHRREMSDTLNKTAITFISQNEESYDARMTIGLKLVCDMANMDRISVWRNFPTPDGLHTSQIYRWDRESGGTTKPTKGLEDVACDMFAPRWEKLLSGGEMINGPVNSMPEAAMLKSFGVVSALVVPLIVKKNFWGFVLFEDRRNERYFEDDYVEIMRSTAFLCMNTVIRAEMEREILEANKTNNLLLNEASVGVITYDENCNLIDCNNKILKMFNCEKPYLLKHFHDLSPECQPDGKNSKEKVFEVVKQMLSDGKITFEWVHQLLSGELMPCEVTLTSVNYMGSNVGIGYLYDLREYKKMLRELALRLEQQQFISEISKNFISFGDSYTLIDEALGKLGKSLNVSRMFIFYVDHEHTDSYVAYQWYADYNVPKFHDNSNFDLFKMIKAIFPKELPEGDAVSFFSCMDSNTDPKFSLLKTDDITSCIRAPLYVEGSLWGIISAENCFAPHKWSEEEISFFTMTSSIIAGAIMRNLYEIKLKEMLSKVTSLSKAKDEFLSKISHEIRTPMNAIMGITEVQLQDETLSKEKREGLNIIYNSGDSLLRIINDLLDLSKLEAKKLEIVPAKYEIASLISDTAQLNIIRIENKPVEFKLKVDKNIPLELMGDELRVKQVLNNILSNAFKYTAAGEVLMSVSAEKYKSEYYDIMLVFRVKDTGQGMTEEQVRKIFDEYSRFNLSSNRSIEGTGLGMSITRNLINLMEGEISVESEPEKGSIFTIRLPQKSASTEILGREASENLQNFRMLNSSQMKKMQIVRDSMPYGRVLIVDDVESNLYVAKRLLNPYDLSLETASNGFDAIEKVKSGKIYDIIFMDHMMPKMDGIEATKIIRDFGYKHPIIALSANAIAGQAEIFIEKGFDGFISKPIDTRQLNAELNRLIRDKQTPEVIAKAQEKAAIKRSMQTVSALDTDLLAIFAQDAKKSLAVFEEILSNMDNATDEDLKLFTINAHAMKSALTNIGEKVLSQIALALETAGKEQDKNTIKKRTRELMDALKKIIEKTEKSKKFAESDGNTAYLYEQLKIVSDACAKYDARTADFALAKLGEMVWSYETGDILEQISKHILFSEFEEAGALALKYGGKV